MHRFLTVAVAPLPSFRNSSTLRLEDGTPKYYDAAIGARPSEGAQQVEVRDGASEIRGTSKIRHVVRQLEDL